MKQSLLLKYCRLAGPRVLCSRGIQQASNAHKQRRLSPLLNVRVNAIAPGSSAGHAIVEVLKAEGVRAVYGIPGGHILPISDGLYDAPEIRHFLVRHEQAAASMAAAYAQLTGETAVCLVTAGPGATNLATNVAEAFVGALPMVILAGRGATGTTYRSHGGDRCRLSGTAHDRLAPRVSCPPSAQPDRPLELLRHGLRGLCPAGSPAGLSRARRRRICWRRLISDDDARPADAAEYRFGVTWCVLNDRALGSIRDIQEFGMSNRIIDTDFGVQPDFAKIAEACGCYGEQVVDPNAVDGAIARALAANEMGIPAVLDFIVARARMQQTYEHYTFYGKS